MKALTVAGTAVTQVNSLYCLNDLHKAAVSQNIIEKNAKRPNKFCALTQTKELVSVLESDDRNRSLETNRNGVRKGTFACKEITLAYANYLSPSLYIFALRAMEAVMQGDIQEIQKSPLWNINRESAAQASKTMCESLEVHRLKLGKPTKSFHYMNEHRMLMDITLGNSSKKVAESLGVAQAKLRDTFSEDQLKAIAWLEEMNTSLITADMDYQARKGLLSKMFARRFSSPVNEQESPNELH